MRIFLFALLLFISSEGVFSQSLISISAGTGINKIFASDPKTIVGFSGFLGIGIESAKTQKRISFTPVFELRQNYFLAPIEEDVFMNLSQTSAGIKLFVGFPITDSWTLKSGILATYLFTDELYVEFKPTVNALPTYQYDITSGAYLPNKFQAGVLLSLAKSIDKKKHFAIEFCVQQMANGFINKDFSYGLFNSEPTVLFRQKSLPTIFSLVFTARFGKNKKEN